MLDALLDALMPAREGGHDWEWVARACNQLEAIRDRLAAAGNGRLAELAADTAALGRRVGELCARDVGGRQAQAYNKQAMIIHAAADLTEKLATGDLAQTLNRLSSERDGIGVVGLVALSYALARFGDLSYVKSAGSEYTAETKALLTELRQKAAKLADWEGQIGDGGEDGLRGIIDWAEPALLKDASSPEARDAVIALFGLIFTSQIRLLKRAALGPDERE